MPAPCIVILSGPNGAGKSTLAPSLLQGELGVAQFVNADVIAQGLAGFAPETSAIAAGRIMLERVRDLASRRQSFAFETTLASRSFAPWLASLREDGYRIHLIYLWLPTPEMAIQRVAARVAVGGHDVPASAVRRRFSSGRRNFFELYQVLADTWRVYDSSGISTPERIAFGSRSEVLSVDREDIWMQILGVNPDGR